MKIKWHQEEKENPWISYPVARFCLFRLRDGNGKLAINTHCKIPSVPASTAETRELKNTQKNKHKKKTHISLHSLAARVLESGPTK